MFCSKDILEVPSTVNEPETISVASMILTRRESNIKTVQKTMSPLTNIMTPHPNVFMSNLNEVEIEIELPKEANERSERRTVIRILGRLDPNTR